jgi:uncharacterized membrane protein (UPF0136 family)
LLGGITAYTRYNSIQALIASFAIAGVSATSAMRIRDGMEWGYEGALRTYLSAKDDFRSSHSSPDVRALTGSVSSAALMAATVR